MEGLENSETQNERKPNRTTKSDEKDFSKRGFSTRKPKTEVGVEAEAQDEAEPDTDELVTDKIISHKKNRLRKHPHADVGKLLYRIRWYELRPTEDTWEPITHILKSKVVGYHNRKKLPLPDNLLDTVDG